MNDPGEGGTQGSGEWLLRAARVLGQILYGATVYEMVRDLRKERCHLEHLFILMVFGDFLGVPVLPPYYTMRLLPYVVPQIGGWRRCMLRERDMTDLCDQGIT
jgi:hypothetical protein